MLKTLCLLLVSVSASALGAGFGFDGIVDEARPLRVDSVSVVFSIRIAAVENFPLQSIALYCLESKNAPAILLSLVADEQGKPQKKILASASLVPSAGAWAVFQFAETPLIKGKTYHALIQFHALRGGSHPVGVVDQDHFASFASSVPGGADSELSVQSGDAWKPVAAKAVYIARGRDAKYLGNSYARSGAADIHGNGTPDDLSDDLLQSEALHFFCGTQASSLRARVRKIGNPKAPLALDVFKHVFAEHKVVLLFSSPGVEAKNISREWGWVTFKFPGQTPQSLPPECHYFALRSVAGRAEGASCADCYQVSWVEAPDGTQGADELTFDAGAHRSRAAWSLNGKLWNDNFNRDLNIVVNSGPCPAQKPAALTPLPTPEYLP